MAFTPLNGYRPIEFTDEGQQFVLPLSAFYLDDTGKVQSNSALYAAHQKQLDALLASLTASGIVQALPEPPPAPAMEISAERAGTAGNDIIVTFANGRPDPNTDKPIFDATVTQKNTYTGLTAATISGIIGDAPGTGTTPGLVYVSSGPNPGVPADTANPIALADNQGAYEATIDDANAAQAFKLRARVDDPEATKITVAIKDLDGGANPPTFTLVASWTDQENALKPEDMSTKFTYLLQVDPPQDGVVKAPADGDVPLKGGTDGGGATKASATVWSG
jgi:hypothetical protein